VTLADELHYVEKYLRLERARFAERLEVKLEVSPEILPVMVPVLSLQPLVENSIRHGVEAGRGGRVEIVGIDLGADARIRVSDDGAGMQREQARAALAGVNGGIGVSNVHRRLQSTFGPDYGLEIESAPGEGTVVELTVPKSHPGARAA
jgi:two-component system LytT family sensor kinase